MAVRHLDIPTYITFISNLLLGIFIFEISVVQNNNICMKIKFLISIITLLSLTIIIIQQGSKLNYNNINFNYNSSNILDLILRFVMCLPLTDDIKCTFQMILFIHELMRYICNRVLGDL